MSQALMPQATQSAFDARINLEEDMPVEARRASASGHAEIRLDVYEDLAAIEQDWRAFEQIADSTVFQSFDWLSTWQQHIGSLGEASPAIVTGRDAQGRLMFLLPLAVERGSLARRLIWLGTDLCDYNGPLLAPDFGQRVDATRFRQLWREITARLQSNPRLKFDVVYFNKMRDVVGAQPNPFIGLGIRPHPNGAYLTHLSGNWETFYNEKRSSSTRQRDRAKRKKLGEFGEVKFASASEAADRAATLDTLMEQKSKAFAAMGVRNIFASPGHRAFYHALAAHADVVHISRLDVGARTAAANLGLIFRNHYYHLLASYDGGELSKYGPGAAHMQDLIRTAIERGWETFDFTIGDERYKREWCDTHVTLYDHVAPATLRGYPAALRLFAAGRLKHFIKQTPALWDAAYKVRAFIGPLMERMRG